MRVIEVETTQELRLWLIWVSRGCAHRVAGFSCGQQLIWGFPEITINSSAPIIRRVPE